MTYTFARRAAAASVCVAASALLLGADNAAAQCASNAPGPVPNMTIKIYNNSATANIYPVLSVGGGVPTSPVVDTWMQAWFGTKPLSCLGTNTYPRSHIYRMYITPTGTGIPAGGSVTITLPLYTPLVAAIDPTKGGQLIDWWQGGGVRVFYSPKAQGMPPVALTRDYTVKKLRPDQKAVAAYGGAGGPQCVTDTGSACTLALFQDDSELPLGDPFQLQEYTLGAVDTSGVPYTLNSTNVDIDVSYVDAAFMPLLVEPYPNKNKAYGWIGIDMDVDPFSATVQRYLANFKGWPQFIDNRGMPILKVPSAINIFVANEVNQRLDDPARADLTPYDPATPGSWAPIVAMRDNWEKASSQDLMDVGTLFGANFANYSAQYTNPNNGWGCNTGKYPEPIDNSLYQTLGHVYGWTPYNTYCAPGANQLYQTPGYYNPKKPDDTSKYQAVKNTFDGLQYNYLTETDPNKVFDPYVDLIHGANYLNAQYAYAFSVDDGVGNLQVDGATGFYLAVGNANGLPNTNPLGTLVNITFGGGDTKLPVHFVKYGVCTDTPDIKVNPKYTTFVMSADLITSCDISLEDNNGALYYARVKEAPPANGYPPYPKQVGGPDFVDCSKDTDPHILTWCQGIFGQLAVDPSNGNTQNDVVTPSPFEPQ